MKTEETKNIKNNKKNDEKKKDSESKAMKLREVVSTLTVIGSPLFSHTLEFTFFYNPFLLCNRSDHGPGRAGFGLGLDKI